MGNKNTKHNNDKTKIKIKSILVVDDVKIMYDIIEKYFTLLKYISFII
jgi:hypothetical protein